MAKKTSPHKRSGVRKTAKREPSAVLSWTYRSRTKIAPAAIASALLATASLAYWKAPDKEVAAPAPVTSEPANKSSVKDVSTLSASELAEIPPEALHPQPPTAAGYNASSGGLPPGALPPGVALPGKPAMQGARTSAQGYGLYDGVRQQFTGKERDNETGLDYFGARYYSSIQGRFTSPDPIPMTSQRLSDPQRLNLYAYVRNNPLAYTDPHGLDLYATGAEAERFKKDLEKATHLKLKLDARSGQITIDGKTPKNPNDAAKQIAKIIGDAKNAVMVDAVRDTSPHDYVLGRFNGNGSQTVNYADVDQLSKKGGYDSRAGAVHETTEAYEGLTNRDPRKTKEDFHLTGIFYENLVRAEQGLGLRSAAKRDDIGTFGNETFISIDYATHTETFTLAAVGNGKFVIKDVRVEKKKQ